MNKNIIRARLWYLLILLAGIIHLQSSCLRDRDEPKPKELPPITTGGRNTIGFLLNGEVWLPGGGAIGSPDKEFVLDTVAGDNYELAISAYLVKNLDASTRQSISLRAILNGKESLVGSYKLREGDYVYFFDYNHLNCIFFENLILGTIEVLYCDLSQKIIAGTFELQVENECGEVYRITEGRFDGRFRYF